MIGTYLREVRGRLVMTSIPVWLRAHIRRVWYTTVAFGLAFTFGSQSLYVTPMFDAMKVIAPVPFWGAGFLLCGAVIVAGAVYKLVHLIQHGLTATASIHSFIAMCYLVGAVSHGGSFVGAIAFGSIAWTVWSASWNLVHRPTVVHDLDAVLEELST